MPARDAVPLRPLGKNGPLVPQLGFGLMGMSYETYGSVGTDEERFAVLDRAVELGSTFWDTSDLYGDSEALLGKWFKRTGKRDQIFLASKYGFKPGFKTDSSYEYTKSCCAKALETMGIDYIDLYYIHSVNPETPIEETMRALKELQDEGKIRHIGLSAVSSSTLRRAVAIAPVAAVQTEYNPFGRDIEHAGGDADDLLAVCREVGSAIVLNSPLGRGILTSTYASNQALGDDKDRRPSVMPLHMPENRNHNMAVVNQLTELAKKLKGPECTVTQLALAWLMSQGEDIFPIPGTKRIKYLEQNWGALDYCPLSPAEEKEVRDFLEDPKNELAGDLFPDAFKHMRFRDTKELGA